MKAIAQLGTKLDDGSMEAVKRSHRTTARPKARLSFAELRLSKQIDRIKAKGLAALKALLKGGNTATEKDRVASLVGGLRFSARLAHTLHDELLDTTGETEVVGLMHDIVHQLDEARPRPRRALTAPRRPRCGVRAYAGAYLIRLMPDRAIPVLRDIEEEEDANSAHFTAYFARMIWEREGKHAAASK